MTELRLPFRGLDFATAHPSFHGRKTAKRRPFRTLGHRPSVLETILPNMATSEPAKSKADAIARVVQKARLQTSFLESRPFHTVRNQAAPGSTLREWWEHKKYIGCGGFGSVKLEKCIDVEVLWDDDDYEDEGNDGDATEKVGSLRAVKQLSKPRGQPKLSGEFLRELYALVSFTDPKVCLPTMPALALARSRTIDFL